MILNFKRKVAEAWRLAEKEVNGGEGAETAYGGRMRI